VLVVEGACLNWEEVDREGEEEPVVKRALKDRRRKEGTLRGGSRKGSEVPVGDATPVRSRGRCRDSSW
jgi:hypothetical protein